MGKASSFLMGSWLAVVAVGCSSSSSGATPDASVSEAGDDATTTDAGGSDAGDAGHADGGFPCAPGDLSDVPALTLTTVMGTPAKAAGGTLTPGRYVQTSYTFYQEGDAGLVDPGAKYQLTMEINDSEIRFTSFDQPGLDAGATPSVVYSVRSYTTNGNALVTTFLCASVADAVGHTSQQAFTSSGDKILTYQPALGYTLVTELTRR